MEVLQTKEGGEAVAAYRAARERGAPVDPALLDLRVRGGGMSGDQAARKILEVDPQARLVVSSGSCDHPCLRDPKAHGFAAAAAKPYSFEELKAVIASALG